MIAPMSACADASREMPAGLGERFDGASIAVASLREERRRCERLGLEVPLARVDAQLRYWNFVGALMALAAGEVAR